MGCISAYGMGSLHVFAKVYKGFRATYASSRRRVFEQDNAKPHTADITTAWLRSRRVPLLNWPACSTDLSPIENIWCIIKRKYVKDDHELFSSWMFYVLFLIKYWLMLFEILLVFILFKFKNRPNISGIRVV